MNRCLFALLILAVTGFASAAESPPPLKREDAKLILEAMNWTDVTIVVVRQGVDSKGVAAPIFATVHGFGQMQGQRRSICQTLYYDSEWEWHSLEMSDKGARLWNRTGYREIKPWGTW